MLLILFAAVALGLGAAGAVLMLPRLVGLHPPRWIAPLTGGVAMFAFMLWNEYTWFDRAAAALPPGVVVAETYDHASALQPWTLAVPRITRFAAVDLEGAARHPDHPGTLLADVMLVERFSGTVRVPQIFDCTAGRRALPPEDLDTTDWDRLRWEGTGEDALVRAACDPDAASGGMRG